MSAAVEREPIVDSSDEEVDALLAEFGGDPRKAIRALLHDLTELAIDSEAAVSRGFVVTPGDKVPFAVLSVGGFLGSAQNMSSSRPALWK
jgi:hypothetical protein